MKSIVSTSRLKDADALRTPAPEAVDSHRAPEWEGTAFSRAVSARARLTARLKAVPSFPRVAASRQRCKIALTILPLFFLLSCSRDTGEKEPAVPVQVTTVEKKTMQRTVTAEAVLFPLQQAAITPKISAPVKAFYIKRGSKVRKGQLLAVLENGDLAAAAEENKGSYDQAQAAYETTTAVRFAAGSSEGTTGRASRQTVV